MGSLAPAGAQFLPVTLTPHSIGRAATLALHDELALFPKPGLVSFHDNGSHRDMDANTFMRSLFALRTCFVQMARLGTVAAPFAVLEACGIEAEKKMHAATGGVNTHRGAIFMLGLLSAATGFAATALEQVTAEDVRQRLLWCWGDALERRSGERRTLPGGIAARRHGLRGASEEAALGFPVLFELVWPGLLADRSAGLDNQQVRLNAFFRSMAALDDCNLASRGGLEGLHFGKAEAQRFLLTGGAASGVAMQQAHRMHQDFVRRNLSAGGSADTLAAACFLQRVSGLM
jgi:triphosphoribosyl-dephospho-CoA synthase